MAKKIAGKKELVPRRGLGHMSQNEIRPGFEIHGLGLYIAPAKTFVISDLHLGYEEMLNKGGVMLPRFNFREIVDRLGLAFLSLKVQGKAIDRIVINGDLKHEFGGISEQEWKEVLGVLEFLQRHCREIILIRGNHDTVLGPIARFRGLQVLDEGLYLPEQRTYLTHGMLVPDNPEFKRAKIVVIGNEHPAISIREGVKSELFKCFLAGKYKGKELIVIPSHNAVTIGSNVLREKPLSPFLKQPLGDFKVWVIEDKPYYFGKIRDLK